MKNDKFENTDEKNLNNDDSNFNSDTDNATIPDSVPIGGKWESENKPITNARFKEIENIQQPQLSQSHYLNESMLTLEELLSRPIVEKEWLVDKLIFKKQISIIGAKPKTGKSTLIRFMSASIVDENSFLGRNCKAGKVLYFALEELTEDAVSDFRDMNVVNKQLIRTGNLIQSTNKIVDFEKLLNLHNPDFVVIDTMIHLAGILDINDYAQSCLNLKKFRDMAEKYNCHICLIHHNRKGDGSNNDPLLGSTGIAGAVDLIMQLNRDSDDTRIFKTDGRSSQKQFDETALHFDFNTKTFLINEDYDNEPSVEFYDFIKNNPGTTRKEIQKSLAKKSSTVTEVLRSLIEQKKVRKQESQYFPTSTGGKNDLY